MDDNDEISKYLVQSMTVFVDCLSRFVVEIVTSRNSMKISAVSLEMPGLSVVFKDRL